MNGRSDMKKYFIPPVVLTIVFLIVGVMIINGNIGNEIEIYYYGNNSSSYENDIVQIFYNYGNGYSEENSSFQTISERLAGFDYKDETGTLQSVRIDFTNRSEPIGIARIEIRSGMFSVYQLSGRQLGEAITLQNCDRLEIYDNYIWITPGDGDAGMVFDREVNDILVSKIQNDRWAKISCLLILGFVLLISYLLAYYLGRTKTKDYMYMILSYAAVLIVGLVICMSMLSVTYGHPDEDETRGSIDYYLSHWGFPNFADESLYNTFSKYGTIRLNELSVYYFLAGKAGWIFKTLFHISAYYRAFNVLLFVVLAVWVIIKGKHHKWLFLPLCVTPQLWYIFSYATSDAWDFFLGFFVIATLLEKGSFIRKALEEKLSGKTIVHLVLYGFLCAFLFMGKNNFYLALLAAFVVLLFRLIREKKKKELFLKYLLILLAFFALYGARVAADYVHYDGNKAQEYRNIRVDHISEEIQESDTFQEKGISILDMYTEEGFAKKIFESFIGCYGWMTLPSGYFYCHIMAFLYIIGLIYIYRNSRNRAGFYAMTGCCALLYMVTVYHSWSVDYQAQGRYLLPCLLAFMYVFAESRPFRSVKFNGIFTAIICLGMYSFTRYGLIPLIGYGIN